MSFRIASFNVENLMSRFDFAAARQLEKEKSEKQKPNFFAYEKTELKERPSLLELEDESRRLTALAIDDCHADIICLQEVEDLATLEAFETNYLTPLTKLHYPHKVLIEGNDSRGIDVALMAKRETSNGEKIEILKARSHKKTTFGDAGLYDDVLKKRGVSPDDRIFRRDCLEVDLKIDGQRMTIFVCHFKSMGSGKPGVSGREHTSPVRQAEAQAVRQVIEKKFGENRAHKMRWVICGDLNDYVERIAIEGDLRSGYSFKQAVEPESALSPLFDDDFCVNLLERREADNRWTLYYASRPPRGTEKTNSLQTEPAVHQLVQLDYLLASPKLAKTNDRALPHIVRQGQPMRTVFPGGQKVDRYPSTGWNRPKASDHCPVAITLKMV